MFKNYNLYNFINICTFIYKICIELVNSLKNIFYQVNSIYVYYIEAENISGLRKKKKLLK